MLNTNYWDGLFPPGGGLWKYWWLVEVQFDLFCAAASACYSWKMLFFVCFQMLEQEEKDNEAVSKMMALDQKNQLLNLFHEKNRPVLAKWPQVNSRQLAAVLPECDVVSDCDSYSSPSPQGTDVLYIVPLFFVDEWKKFIRCVWTGPASRRCWPWLKVSLVCSLCRRPTKSSPVSNVGNTLLLCPHGGFMFTYDSLINGDAQQWVRFNSIHQIWRPCWTRWSALMRCFVLGSWENLIDVFFQLMPAWLNSSA